MGVLFSYNRKLHFLLYEAREKGEKQEPPKQEEQIPGQMNINDLEGVGENGKRKI